MRSLTLSLLTAAAAAFLLAPSAARAQGLLENGSFDNPGDPLKGWVIDYAFAGNSHYMANKDFVKIATEGARKNIVTFVNPPSDAGAKMECRAFPLEPGFRYVCNLDVKGNYRLYFAGYKWAPGVAPHANPELGELRMIYQSKATVGSSDAWKTEKMELPGVALSDAAIDHLKQVRFLTVYIWMATSGAVDNVVLTKVPDPAMKF